MNNVIASRRHGKQVFYSLNGSVDVDDDTVHIGADNYTLQIVSKAALRL